MWGESWQGLMLKFRDMPFYDYSADGDEEDENENSEMYGAEEGSQRGTADDLIRHFNKFIK